MTPQTTDQFGVCSWSLQAAGPKDLAEKVGALGLRKVQLGITPHRDDPGALDGVSEILGEAGITIVSGMYSTIGEDYTTPETIRKTGGVVLDQYWDENIGLARAAAAKATELGLPHVTAHAGFLPHDASDPSYDKLSGRVARLAEIFAEQGVGMLLETGQESAPTLLAFLDDMKRRGADNVAVNFDPANMILYDMDDPIEALRALAPHVRQVHVKDARRTATKGDWGEEVVVGTGEVDFDAFVRILAEADFSGGFIFEREAGDDRIGDITKGIARLRQAIVKLTA